MRKLTETEIEGIVGLIRQGKPFLRTTRQLCLTPIMVIYIDIFGNQKREVKTLFDFNDQRKK